MVCQSSVRNSQDSPLPEDENCDPKKGNMYYLTVVYRSLALSCRSKLDTLFSSIEFGSIFIATWKL